MANSDIAGIRINGGRLCLDFGNTATYSGNTVLHDFLTSYRDLLTWGGRAGLIARAELRTRLAWAASHPEAASAVLESARRLRAAIRALFRASPSADNLGHLAAINAALADAGSCRIAPGGRGYVFAANADALRWLTGPVAISAAELATSEDARRVRACAGDGCEWLFLDTSRNGTRRWCSMASCGNRAKARSHYARTRKSERRRASAQ